MTELKPCPFCGGEDIHIGWTDFDSGVIFVECETCGMYCEPKDCYANEPKAIAAWNTRAERTCKVEKLVEGTTPDGYQAYVWHCLSCGGKMFGGDYALYGHVPPRFCSHCGARVERGE